MQTAQRIPLKPILAQVIAYSVDRRPQHHAPPDLLKSHLHDLLRIHNADQEMMTATESTRIMIEQERLHASTARKERYDKFSGQHAALENICIVNCQTGERIAPNSVPQKLENDCFSGEVLMLLRTPDVDDPNEVDENMGETPRRISHYMKDKSRRFEFQFQVKLKEVPKGPLFLGCELEHPVQTSRLMKGLAGVLLSMIGRINKGFHYSLYPEGDPQVVQEGKYEKTHLAFPVEASMDRIIVTKKGETPPKLGGELFEPPESVKRRRQTGAGSVDWNVEDTYTMCLWSAYFDWIQWKSLNVPGIRPFSLGSVVGKQPVYLSFYELPKYSPQDYRRVRPRHYRKDIREFTRLEFTHARFTQGGMGEGVRKDPYMIDCSSFDTESIGSDSELEQM